MKKVLFLAFALSVLAAGAMAQSKTPYAGIWKLDLAKSKIEGPMRVGSATITVVETAKNITITTETKRPDPPANVPSGPPPGSGALPPGMGGGLRVMGGGRFGSLSDGTVTYSLDGKETKAELDGGPGGKIPVIYKGNKEANGNLKLSSSQTMMGPNGEITITRKETWKLAPDGSTLTVEREQTTARGASTSTLVFVRG